MKSLLKNLWWDIEADMPQWLYNWIHRNDHKRGKLVNRNAPGPGAEWNEITLKQLEAQVVTDEIVVCPPKEDIFQ